MESYSVIVKIVGRNDTRAISGVVEATSVDDAKEVVEASLKETVNLNWDE